MGLPPTTPAVKPPPDPADDGWAAAFAAANAGATVLDDPEELEDRAIYRWMKGHILPRFYHTLPRVKGRQFILGNTPLPYHWMQQSIHFATLQEARAFVDHLRRNTAAMRIVVDLLRKADGSLLICETVDATLDRLARLLINGRLWLMPYQRPHQPDIGATDPAVYARLNGQFGTRLDAAKLSAWEGGQYLRGYVPFTSQKNAAGVTQSVVAGRSGMTIATGFDIGQHTGDYLRGITGLSARSLALLLPYAGKQFTHLDKPTVIKRVGMLGPIPVIDKGEADALDGAVAEDTLKATMTAWAANRKSTVPVFSMMPSAWQTVMFSRTYNQGAGWVLPGSPTRSFFTFATQGKWREAATALRDAPVTAAWYRSRLRSEAGYLATDMPKPLVPAAPAPSPSAMPGVPSSVPAQP
ncbi:MAG TPA: pesticin C-terminus-like muramidase [Acetobacteraceae bacterium]|nr:pesticin C-terminus-like muramidase [Acetobacteraceae bacterium]